MSFSLRTKDAVGRYKVLSNADLDDDREERRTRYGYRPLTERGAIPCAVPRM
jgi:hypothetical protein